MIDRLVALMASIRPTVRRVTKRLATRRKNEYQQDAQGEGGLDPRRELVEIFDVSSHQQMRAVGERLESRPQTAGSPHPASTPGVLKVFHPLASFRDDGHASRLPATGA